jgi:uncharacterized protein (TIGR00251 family)
MIRHMWSCRCAFVNFVRTFFLCLMLRKMASWYVKRPDGTSFNIYLKVQPNAKKTEIISIEETDRQRLKIKLAAPPVDGKANKQIVSFIADQLRTAKSNVCLVRGEKDTSKELLCQSVTEDQVLSLISEL